MYKSLHQCWSISWDCRSQAYHTLLVFFSSSSSFCLSVSRKLLSWLFVSVRGFFFSRRILSESRIGAAVYLLRARESSLFIFLERVAVARAHKSFACGRAHCATKTYYLILFLSSQAMWFLEIKRKKKKKYFTGTRWKMWRASVNPLE